jgi:predicted component of type VI protein secretion system
VGNGEEENLVDRLSRQSEEALGRVAEELVGNPVVAGALSRAFSAREKAMHAQEAAMGALGIPSAADVERLTRRLRSVSQRLEAIEDSLDRLEVRLETAAMSAEPSGTDDGVEARLEEVSRDIAALREALVPGSELPPRSQERLTVGSAGKGGSSGRPRGASARLASS